MEGEKVMRECSQPRTWSRKQNLKGCQMNQALHDVIIIDVDTDNVILIDEPESIPPNLVSSSVSRKGKKIEFPGVISIDDDETDDEDSTSSAPDEVPKPEKSDDDECRVVLEETSVFGSSKRQQAHTGKSSHSNRYGLYGVYESCSSDNDSSDCEVMEGSCGKLHEEWKKAFSKRKFNARKNGKHCSEDQSSSFFVNVNNTQTGVADDLSRRNEKFSETAFPSDSSRGNNKNQNFSAFGQAEDGHWPTASENAGEGSSFWDFHQNNYFSWPPDFTESAETSLKMGDFDFSRGTNADDPSSSSYRSQETSLKKDTVHMEKNTSQEPPLCSTRKPSAKNNDSVNPCCTDQGKDAIKDHSTCQEFNKHFPHGKTNFDNGDVSLGMCQKSCQVPFNNERTVPNSKDESFTQEIPAGNTSPIKLHRQTGKVEKEKVFSRDVNSQPSKETEAEFGARPSDFEAKRGGKDAFHAQGDIVNHSVQGDIITEREKLKETDDYKRAMEEEWASRKQQLKIQAEEVQRLRKKKKAESMRLLDMERRQKQRLEEIRETQKKDEENMNLKEQLRVQVRKELYILEVTCVDMASLLSGLGIHVGNGLNPLSHEVHAAYKRALLRFHPDRASKTDLRQQVEAEEKFKLISRMKEKLLLT